jgi:hypothetical protein
MEQRKRKLAWFLICSLCITLVQGTTGKSEAAVIKKKGYTLSQKAGSYRGKVTVALKAQKGYKVYYSTKGVLDVKKVLKNGKTKKFTFKKTKTLTVYASKKSKKITKKEWNKIKSGKTAKKYKYVILNEESSATETPVPTLITTPTPAATVTSTAAATSTASATSTPGGNPSIEIPSGGNPAMGTPSGGNPSMGTPPGGNSSMETPPAGNLPGNNTEASSTGNPESAQNILDSAEAAGPVEKQIPVSVENTTPEISLSVNSSGETVAATANLEDANAVSVEENRVTITKAGTYVLTGGEEASPIVNTNIRIETKTDEDVNVILKDLYIDNSAMGGNKGEDEPVLFATKQTTKVNIILIGKTVLKGNGSYTSETASGIVYAKDSGAVLTLMASEQDADAALEIVDSMPADTDFGTESPSDGIASKGTVTIQSGVYKISSNGDGIKGKTAVNLIGGEVAIESYSDGIQGENVWIGGNETKLDITTKSIYAGKNYYSTNLGSGNYNIITTTGDSVKNEVVNVDTGSHKGIKAGTKACTYQYETVEEGSSYTAGTTYTKEASGGLVITGGEIKIDTTNTGIKYNGSSVGNNSSDNSLTPADSDGKYIIGTPDDAIHSNNTCVIVGGKLELASADDGITSGSELLIMNNAVIDITKAYEGMEGGYIVIGKSSTSDSAPEISIYSDDDGVNAASKTSVSYVYKDENELSYTKTETSSGNNEFYMLEGSLKITISDDVTHTFSLPVAGQSSNTVGSYTGDGDGIDCNGSFYGYNGKVTVYGSTSGDNSPIDTDGTYYIGAGITLLALGTNGMSEEPTLRAQPVIEYGNSNVQNKMGQRGSMNGGGGMGQPGSTNGGGGMGQPGSTNGGGGMGQQGNTIAANALLTVLDSSNETILSLTSPKNFSYFLYSSPELVLGNTYQLKTGETTLSTSLTAAS